MADDTWEPKETRRMRAIAAAIKANPLKTVAGLLLTLIFLIVAALFAGYFEHIGAWFFDPHPQTTTALIHEYELSAQNVLARLDEDIDNVERQAQKATLIRVQKQRAANDLSKPLSKQERREYDAYERALRESFDMTKQLQDIKLQFSRLFPEHLKSLRADERTVARSIESQITYQLHDRYLKVMSHNSGFNSSDHPAIGYANQFEHVIIDGLTIVRTKPIPDQLYAPNKKP